LNSAARYHWKLPAGFFRYVIAHGCYKIYIAQARLEDGRSVLGEPFDYFGARIENANYREILRAMLDVDHIASPAAQILRRSAAKGTK
jgi:hypothetical protein